jgi:glycosyltransferase involved in cell wall biosynthesis
MHLPLVSFIIASFNEEKYIIDCVESCLNQTYKNTEVVITDDGSTDNTVKILKERYSNNHRVKINQFAQNQKKISAYNKSFAESKGEFIAIVGADDINSETRIEEQMKHMGDYDLTMCDLSKVNSDNTNTLDKNICRNTYPKRRDFTFQDLVYNNFGLPSILMKREAAIDAFPLPLDLEHEDYWIPIWHSFTKPVLYTTEPLYFYRMHDNNLSGNNLNHNYSHKENEKLATRDLTYWTNLQQKLIQKGEMDFVFFTNFHIVMLSCLKNFLSTATRFQPSVFESFLRDISKKLLFKNPNFEEGISLLHHTKAYHQRFSRLGFKEGSEMITSIMPEHLDDGASFYKELEKKNNSKSSILGKFKTLLN